MRPLKLIILFSVLILSGCYEMGYVAGKSGYYVGMGAGEASLHAPQIIAATAI